MPLYDAIVLGTGGVGSSAAFHLARNGCKVLGLDRFPGGHDRGSSHGHTRIIRMAYFEHPDYVPLLRRSYALWSELEHRQGKQLYFPVGLLEVGPANGVVVPGVLASAAQHKLSIERLDSKDLRSRFPGFSVPVNCEAVFENNAGYLLVEQSVLAHLEAARQHGAQLLSGESVMEWTSDGKKVVVRTDKNTYEASKLIVTAGAWAGKLLADLGVRLTVRRKHLHWYATATEDYQADRGGPGFFFETPEGYFYGFPQVDDRGVKVAEHSGGIEVDDPLQDDRSIEPRDRERVEAFLAQALPGVTRRATGHVVCYYTMSPDENFIVDRHPKYENVCFAAGLSGHGFKFTSVLGEILADLTLKGASTLPIQFLSVSRPGLKK